MSVESVTARIETIRARMDALAVPASPAPAVVAPAGASGQFSSVLAAARGGATAATSGVVQSGAGGTLPSSAAAWQAASRPAAVTSPSPVTSTPGQALSDADLKSVLEQAGFSGEALRVAWALARRESGGRPDAVSRPNSNGTIDHGLFQINDVHRKAGWIEFDRLSDPVYNAKVAFRMSDGGRDFSAWALGSTGWAGHLQQTAPATYQALQDRFQAEYDKYPF